MTLRALFVLAIAATAPTTLVAQEASPRADFELDPISREIQNFPEPQIRPQLVETSGLIRVNEARDEFNVDGSRLTAAVLDTGANAAHLDFDGKIPIGLNFSTDYAGLLTNFDDGQGHGTNVAGVIVANGIHKGIAPGSKVVPLKVLTNAGSGSFDWTRDALQWVFDNRATYDITVVNMSLGDSSNARDDDVPAGVLRDIKRLITRLREKRVAVCIAAGNDFFSHDSQQGMGFPAICRDSISVGAVYDNNEGGFSYASGAVSRSSGPNVVTPFSQRLHPSKGDACRTDIFAPGAPMTSTGIGTARAESVMHGTSQACPTVAGAVLLLQQFARRETGELPTVAQLENWLCEGVSIVDGDDENDNVKNTNKTYVALDVYRSLQAAENSLGRQKRDYRELGYAAYEAAYYAKFYSAYALAYDEAGVFAPYADAHAEQAFAQASAVGWLFQYQAGQRKSDFARYAAQRYYQYANSYWAYLYATYDWQYYQNVLSLYAAQYSYNAYSYGLYDAS